MSAAQERGQDGTVDRHRKGLAYARIIERLSIDGEAVIFSAELRHTLETRRFGEPRLLQGWDTVVVDKIDLSLLVHREGRGHFIDHEHLDVFDGGRAEKKIGIGLEPDLILVLP